MSPLYGLMASQISGHLETNAFESIATFTVSGSTTTSVTFSSIPQTYKHLQLRFVMRSSDAGSYGYGNISLNGNQYTTDYSAHTLEGNGGSTNASGAANAGGIGGFYAPAAGITSNVFSTGIVDILDYTNTNKYKTVRALYGWDANGSGFSNFISGSLRSTSAVSSLSMFNMNFAQYSSFALYGVKG